MIDLVFAGHRDRLMREHNDRAWLAWWTAGMVRAKKMPRLERLQQRPRVRRRQSGAELLSIFTQINAALGGDVIAKPES